MNYTPRPRVISVDTVVPPPPSEPGPSDYDKPTSSIIDDGYYKPKDTINHDIVRSVEAVRRATSMQTPRQLLLSPRQPQSWSHDMNHKSPAIIISPPSEEHLPPLPHLPSPRPKHRRSMVAATCVALFVVCTVVGLIFLFVHMS